MLPLTSLDVGRAALKMAVTDSRTEEQSLRQTLLDQQQIQAVAIDFGANNPGMREANAKRLVACWNALDGLSDDALGGGWTAAGMNAYAKGLEEKLRVARALLLDIKKMDDKSEIADHDEGMPCTSAQFDGVMASVREALKGGAV